MRFQIRTLEVPLNWGTTAFVPIPAQSSTATFNGQNLVTGAPGTVPVKSPKPPALDDGELGGPLNQPSNVAPNWILPSIYVAHPNKLMQWPNSGAPGPYVSAVPAVSLGSLAGAFMRKVRLGGTTVTKSVRPFIQWPVYGSSK